MVAGNLIEILIDGNDVAPGTISNRDLAVILTTAEDMFTSVVEQDNPQLSESKVFLGLVNIRNGSIGLQFAPSHADVVFPVLYKITRSVQQGDYSELPPSTVKSLQSMKKIAKNHN